MNWPLVLKELRRLEYGLGMRRKAGSFFADCDRDELGRCKPGSGGGDSGGDSGGEEKPDAEKPSKGPKSPYAKPPTSIAELQQLGGKNSGMSVAPFPHVADFPFDGKTMNEALDKFDVTEETVPLADLIVEQVGVENAGVKAYMDDPAKVSDSEESDPRYNDGLIVVRSGGKLYLADGNHRATAGVLNGMKDMKAYVVDLPVKR